MPKGQGDTPADLTWASRAVADILGWAKHHTRPLSSGEKTGGSFLSSKADLTAGTTEHKALARPSSTLSSCICRTSAQQDLLHSPGLPQDQMKSHFFQEAHLL